MRGSRRFVASTVISLSLIASSTAAVAQSARAPVPQFDPWAVLSALSGGAPAAAVCGAAAATAAQPGNGCVLPQTGVTPTVETPQNVAPPPGPPPPPPAFLPIPVLLVLAGVLASMIYIATQNNHVGQLPNSPA